VSIKVGVDGVGAAVHVPAALVPTEPQFCRMLHAPSLPSPRRTCSIVHAYIQGGP